MRNNVSFTNVPEDARDYHFTVDMTSLRASKRRMSNEETTMRSKGTMRNQLMKDMAELGCVSPRQAIATIVYMFGSDINPYKLDDLDAATIRDTYRSHKDLIDTFTDNTFNYMDSVAIHKVLDDPRVNNGHIKYTRWLVQSLKDIRQKGLDAVLDDDPEYVYDFAFKIEKMRGRKTRVAIETVAKYTREAIDTALATRI